MRYFVIVFFVFLFLLFFKFEQKRIEMELLVYEMYTNNFKDYVIINEDYDFCFNKEKLKEYLEGKGYMVDFKSEHTLIVYFKYIFEFEKEYSFYLEKNHDIK